MLGENLTELSKLIEDFAIAISQRDKLVEEKFTYKQSMIQPYLKKLNDSISSPRKFPSPQGIGTRFADLYIKEAAGNKVWLCRADGEGMMLTDRQLEKIGKLLEKIYNEDF